MYYESKGGGYTRSTETEHKTLEEVIDKLVSIPDVSGAAIVRADGSVISWCAKDGHKPTQDIDFINKSISAAYKKNIRYYKEGIFTESIIDHNGHKILMSKIKEDVMLLLMLDRRAYLGLTMLDIECCLREMDKALDENCSSVSKI